MFTNRLIHLIRLICAYYQGVILTENYLAPGRIYIYIPERVIKDVHPEELGTPETRLGGSAVP